MSEFKAFSAPGKALLVGGYLVLDREYDSYVVALSSRMHAVIRCVDPIESSRITVKSPQFHEGKWEFSIEFEDGSYNIVEENGRQNPFVINTIETILYYIYPDFKFNLEINIFSDPGYHSTEDTIQKESFLYHSKSITKVAKTGLGSSAGLVTVLTTALLSFFIKDFKLDENLNRIHNLAQVAHCHSQGKVGSGFDVAAATFGSIVYKRFDPILINELTNERDLNYNKELLKLIDDSNWEIKNDKVKLPNEIKLIMGDIKTGSNTPKLVSKVLNWKKSDPESLKIYTELSNLNNEFINCLNKLDAIDSTESYKELIKFISQHNTESILHSTNEDLAIFKDLINTVIEIRKYLREISKRSGAEIEPIEQTALLDNCLKLNGVLAGVVPGAGGYDAICLLITKDSIKNLKEISKINEDFSQVHWLELSEESNGIQIESIEKYINLI